MTEDQGSYYEKLHNWWKNIPALVWIVVATGVLGGSLGLLGAFQQTFDYIWKPSPAELLHISIKPKDPRFISAGERLNWGGGSQALFVEFDRKSPGKVNLQQWADVGGDTRVWETIHQIPMTIKVDVIYNAEPGSPTSIIDEFGVKATPISQPGPGQFFWYLTGGAEGLRARGESLLQPEGGFLPVSLWVDVDPDEGEEIQHSEKVHHLRPGEPLFLEIDVGRPKKVLATNASKLSAFSLQVYARIRIKGESTVVLSEESIQILIPWSKDQVEWVNSDEEEGDAPPNWHLEDLRPQAYIKAEK